MRMDEPYSTHGENVENENGADPFPELEFRRLLRSHPLPTGLRERVLAAVRAEVTRVQATVPESVETLRRARRWRRRGFLTAGVTAAVAGLWLSARWWTPSQRPVRSVGPELLMMTAVTRFDAAVTNRLWGRGESVEIARQMTLGANGDWPQRNFGPWPQVSRRNEPDFCGQTAWAYDVRSATGILATLYTMRAMAADAEEEPSRIPDDVTLKTVGLSDRIPDRAMYPTAGRAAAAWAENRANIPPPLQRVFVLVVAGQPDDYRRFLAPQITGTIG